MTSNIRNLIIGIFLCGSTLPLATLVMAQPKPVPPSSLQTAPAMRSVGQVNPGSPIDVVVKNNTSVMQSAGFSGGANVKIEPGGKATLSFASAPVNLFIYPFGPGMSTKYTVTSSGNTINVEVNPLNSVTPGDGALNVSRSGMVYVN
jgi:hypothetical protein